MSLLWQCNNSAPHGQAWKRLFSYQSYAGINSDSDYRSDYFSRVAAVVLQLGGKTYTRLAHSQLKPSEVSGLSRCNFLVWKGRLTVMVLHLVLGEYRYQPILCNLAQISKKDTRGAISPAVV